MQDEWITISTLGTFGGVVFAVTLMAQFLKDLIDKVLHIPTRLLVLVLSWIVLLGRSYMIIGAFTFDGVFLDLLNGFLVALAAMGTHSLAKDNLQWK